MVDNLQNQRSPFKGHIGDIVLPDFPPSAEAFAARALQRLYLRRWLVMLTAGVIAIFVILYGLPLLPAILGFASIAAGAGILPREGVMRPLRLNLRASERGSADKAAGGLIEGLPAPALLLSAQGRVLR
ncbi:MAG: hypothetical protein HC850_14850, partial [Rhodomicrobium sp.]|nr:hypothetical protein [Rhodomicrobium sp.]